MGGSTSKNKGKDVQATAIEDKAKKKALSKSKDSSLGRGQSGTARGTASAGASRVALDRPDDKTIDAEFEALLVEMSLPADKAAAMRAFSSDRIIKHDVHTFKSDKWPFCAVGKWILIQQQRTAISPNKMSDAAGQSGTLMKAPAQYVEALRSNMTAENLHKELTSLDVALRTLAVSWIGEFLKADGLAAFFHVYRIYFVGQNTDSFHRDVRIQLIRCVKSFMNNSIGLNGIITYPNGIGMLALGLDCDDNFKTKAIVVELLGAVCFVSRGHKLVLEAMDYYQTVKNEAFRFQSIMKDFYATEDQDYMVGLLAFINAVVNTPESCQLRLCLRAEFLRLGILRVLERLSKRKSIELQRQLDVFEDQARSDFMERSSDDVDLSRVDLSDLDSVYQAIKQTLTSPEDRGYVGAAFQQLLLLTAGAPEMRSRQWMVVEMLVREVALQKFDLQFNYDRLNVDLKEMMGGFARKEDNTRLRVQIEELKKAQTNTGKVNEKADAALKSKQEEIVRLRKDLEEQIARSMKLEEEVHFVRKKLEDQSREMNDLKAIQAQERSAWSTTSKLENIKNETQNETSSAETLKKSEVTELEVNLVTPTAPPLTRPPVSPRSPKPLEISATQAPSSTELPSPPRSAPPPPPPPAPPTTGAPPPPAPPMSNIGKAIPPAKKWNLKKSDTKMKQLQWTKIKPNASSVWAKMNDNTSPMLKLLQVEELEDQFRVEAAKTKSKMNLAAEEEARTKVISLLDSKKAYNMAIMLSRVKMTFPELRLAILQMSDDLSEQLVRQLLQYIPTTEEQVLISENMENLENLGKAEQFYAEMLKIDRYEQHLRCMLFKKKFKERVDDLLPEYDTLWKACAEVRESAKFCQLLELILVIGNYVNGATLRGNADGFRLDTLLKLNDIRSNHFGTMLHYVAKLVQQKLAHLREYPADIPNLERASKISLQGAGQEFVELQRGMDEISHELPHHENPSDPGDQFHTVMKTFLEKYSKDFEALQERKQEAEKRFQGILDYFGEPSTATPESFFGTIFTFSQHFSRACVENEREAENLLRRKSKPLVMSEETLLERSPSSGGFKLDAGVARRGVMDELINSLKTGAAITKRTEERRKLGIKLSGEAPTPAESTTSTPRP